MKGVVFEEHEPLLLRLLNHHLLRKEAFMQNVSIDHQVKEGEGKDAFAPSVNGQVTGVSSLAEELRRQEGLLTGLGAGRDVAKETLAVMAEQVADRRTDWLSIQSGTSTKK